MLLPVLLQKIAQNTIDEIDMLIDLSLDFGEAYQMLVA